VHVFEQDFALDDGIGSHACSLEANMCGTNGIPLGSPLPLYRCHHKSCRNAEGFDQIGSEGARALALDAARQALVLLKNDAHTLPLSGGGVGGDDAKEQTKDAKTPIANQVLREEEPHPTTSASKLALIGPHATTTWELGGNYFEDICPNIHTDCIPSMASAFANVGIKPIVCGAFVLTDGAACAFQNVVRSHACC
jgi:beta-glucosidase-like glycosyl hydrolase